MMTTEPTPEEATAALRDVDERTGQAVSSAIRNRSRLLDIVVGLVLIAQGVCTDFFPRYSSWASWTIAVIFVAYGVASYSRRGSSALGERVRVRRPAVSRKYTTVFMTILGVFFAAAIIAQVVSATAHVSWHVPYLATVTGVVFGIAIIGFGPRLRAGMARLSGAGR